MATCKNLPCRGNTEATPGLPRLWEPGAAAQGEEIVTAGGDFPWDRDSGGTANSGDTQSGTVEHPGAVVGQLGATSGNPGVIWVVPKHPW